MSLRTSESVLVLASPDDVFPTGRHTRPVPGWLRLVHEATPDDAGRRPAWSVEIRARVGPFARSKRLRMERLAVRTGSNSWRSSGPRWTAVNTPAGRCSVEVDPTAESSSLVTMHLAYDGALWTGGLLDRVLEEEIRKGRAGLTALVSGEPTR